MNPITYKRACKYAREALGPERFWPAGTYTTLLYIHATIIMKAAKAAYRAGRKSNNAMQPMPKSGVAEPRR
jgi:hypothetical protein